MALAAQDVLKTKFEIEPDAMQKAITICILPFSFKIVYGFISDNIPILGSKKKSYLLIWSFIQFLSMAALAYFPIVDLTFSCACVFVCYLGVAFADVIVDSLMVINARKDPVNGSAKLQTFTWTC